MPITKTDLYRRGNMGEPRLAQVRIGKDISIFQINGIDWIAANSGGVSTFSEPGDGKNWWLLPAGFEYPDELTIVNDHGNHYNWEPSADMPLAEFIALLQAAQMAFRKIN